MTDAVAWPDHTYVFRPLDKTRSWARYAGGYWINDDGEFDLAFYTLDNYRFPYALYVQIPYYRQILWSWKARPGHDISRHPGGNFGDPSPWHYMTVDNKPPLAPDPRYDSHPNELTGRAAMDACAKVHGCANGRGPSFKIGDKFIAAGVLKIRETGEAVRFPDRFVCIYCGELPVVFELKGELNDR